MNSQEYYLNIRPGDGYPQTVKVSQGDVGRPLLFHLMDGVNPLSIPAGATITIHGTKPSGLGFTETCTVSGSSAAISTTLDITQEYGLFPAELVVSANDDIIATANFSLFVERSPHPDGTTDGTKEELDDLYTEVANLKEDIAQLSLGIDDDDGMAYIYLNGVKQGEGIEIGGTTTRHNVSWTLTDVTPSTRPTKIVEGRALSVTLTATSGKVVSSVAVLMGGTDITSTAYNDVNDSIYIASVSGDVSITAVGVESVAAFVADFSGSAPLASQFYAWEGRDFGAITDSLANISCSNNVADLTATYDSTRAKWVRQMMCTGGIFEADNFTVKFKAMFDGTAGSWQNVITYGTGCHWTDGTYSDGVKWPAAGEIDMVEQAGGYSATPNTFSPVFHYGSGSNSNYPNTHLFQSIASGLSLPVDIWADYKIELQDGVVKIYVNDTLVAQGDGSDLAVNNNYLWNYKPFVKPQAFYIDGQCASSSESIDTSNTFHFYVKDFEVVTESKRNTRCTGLVIYPQMWTNGTTLIFPTNAEIYFDRIYTPTNTSNKACTWTTSDASIATVCEGYVKTVSEGTCTISATCGTVTATYDLTVSNANANVPCAGVVVNSGEVQIVGTSSTDISNIIYKYPRFTTDQIVLSSSDTSVATVNGTTITGVNEGDATITVTCGATSATIPVSVSSGIIFESDIAIVRSEKTLSNEAIVFDKTQTYSFQYTFSALTPTETSTFYNCIVGPATSNNLVRAGAVIFIGSDAKWYAQYDNRTKVFTPQDGDVLTFVVNFATNKQWVYLNDTAIVSNSTVQATYYDTMAKLYQGRQNAGMTAAPTHIKIAIGDLHAN